MILYLCKDHVVLQYSPYLLNLQEVRSLLILVQNELSYIWIFLSGNFIYSLKYLSITIPTLFQSFMRRS